MSQPSSPVLDLLHPLALAGWRFWLEEGRLRYRAPRDAATAAVLEQLREHKTAISELLAAAPDCLEICPLSYGQAALWFLWRLAPESHAYNQSLPLRIAESDDATAEAAAAADIVVRAGRDGKSQACNLGLSESDADVVVFTDAESTY